MGKIYRIGTRGSPLALRQVDEVLENLRKAGSPVKAAIVKIETSGDSDRLTPISDIEGTDFFTREIDEALLKGEIDFAVHSAKDLPDTIRQGLLVAAVTGSLDPHDALVSKGNLKLEELPCGARVGTSSRRRKEWLKAYRSDLESVDIRGNIKERLELLEAPGELDAVIVAACGLVRLGLEYRIAERISLERLQPHPLQGSLAVEVRADDGDLIKLLSAIDSKKQVDI